MGRHPAGVSISGRFVRTAAPLDLSSFGARVYLPARIPSLSPRTTTKKPLFAHLFQGITTVIRLPPACVLGRGCSPFHQHFISMDHQIPNWISPWQLQMRRRKLATRRTKHAHGTPALSVSDLRIASSSSGQYSG